MLLESVIPNRTLNVLKRPNCTQKKIFKIMRIRKKKFKQHYQNMLHVQQKNEYELDYRLIERKMMNARDGNIFSTAHFRTY